MCLLKQTAESAICQSIPHLIMEAHEIFANDKIYIILQYILSGVGNGVTIVIAVSGQ